MTLLIKWPSRSRPKLFRDTAQKYVDTMTRPMDTRWVLTLDSDDSDVREYIKAIHAVFSGLNYEISIANSRGKVHAINRGMDASGEWDAVYLASDDMVPVVSGWDAHIIKTCSERGGDCLLWMNGGDQKLIPTLMAMGRRYFDRFRYLYHPDYVSLWCDNEAGEVASQLGCVVRDCKVWIRNLSPDWGGPLRSDPLYRRNNRYFEIDKRTYIARKAKGFPPEFASL